MRSIKCLQFGLEFVFSKIGPECKDFSVLPYTYCPLFFYLLDYGHDFMLDKYSVNIMSSAFYNNQSS